MQVVLVGRSGMVRGGVDRDRDPLLDTAVAFVEAGLSAVAAR
jgi:hypothetical protein